jgi:hypothetical protein
MEWIYALWVLILPGGLGVRIPRLRPMLWRDRGLVDSLVRISFLAGWFRCVRFVLFVRNRQLWIDFRVSNAFLLRIQKVKKEKTNLEGHARSQEPPNPHPPMPFPQA